MSVAGGVGTARGVVPVAGLDGTIAEPSLSLLSSPSDSAAASDPAEA